MVSFPYSYYRCSCAGVRQQEPGIPSISSTLTTAVPSNGTTPDGSSPQRRLSGPATVKKIEGAGAEPDGNDDDELEDHDETFDPADPRSNYSLFPLDALMWCEDCQDIRCPRCTSQEIVCWYCPNCLFEVPSSTVRSEGNRCTRNCFNCPECTTQLSINSLDPDPNSTAGPYILSCGYCNWTSLDIGMKFSTPRYIYNQLQQHSQPGSSSSSKTSSSRLSSSRTLETVPEPSSGSGNTSSGGSTPRATSPNPSSAGDARRTQDANVRFQTLKAFYKQQLQAAHPGDGLMYSDMNYSSPGHLSRVLALYSSSRSSITGGASSLAAHKSSTKAALMRDAADASEGLQLLNAEADRARVARLKEAGGWAGTATGAQRREQLGWGGNGAGSGVATTRSDARLLTDLRPVPTLLRTKRSARCRACRHILVKPEAKIGSTRYRIKLAAAEHVPSMVLTPLGFGGSSAAGGGQASGAGSNNAQQQLPPLEIDLHALPPSRTLQFLLKVTNRVVDAGLRVTLATPRETPTGRHGARLAGGSRVTILCPQFDVGANMDVWDEALRRGGATSPTKRAGSPTKSAAAAAGTGEGATVGGAEGGGSEKGTGTGTHNEAGTVAVAEAGKPWERGRNWTSVVVEVVPKRISKIAVKNEDEDDKKENDTRQEYVDEDEDVLEIPIFVRLEFIKSGAAAASVAAQDEKAGDGVGADGDASRSRKNAAQRQLSYWTVLGVGRIKRD